MLIHQYKENWIKDFNDIRAAINHALMNIPIFFEHVGSTSISGLAAKPIIDIDIVFGVNVDFGEIKSRLEKIGYFHAGDQGIKNREVFKRDKVFNHNVLDKITHHLYVCPIDSDELKKHLLFRDYLRANEDARIEYQKLKYEIAEEANQNKQRYAEIKELKAAKFIDNIIAEMININDPKA